MHLGNVNVKARPYFHWLSRLLPSALTDQEKAILIPKIKQKDKDAIERMIEGHTGLIAQVVGRYAWQQPRKTDDMLSVGWLTLTEAVVNFANGGVSHDNITGYIITKVHGAIHNFIVEDQAVKPPRNSFEEFTRHSLEDVDEGIEHEFETPDNLIDEVGLETRERVVALMALEGYTDREIGKRIGCSEVHAGRLRNIVGQKILRKMQ